MSIGSNKLTLNGGSIKDAADNGANLSHSALVAQSDHRVDGIPPTIAKAPHFVSSSDSTDGVHITGEQFFVSAGFSEDVIVTGTPRMKLNMQSGTRYTAFDYAIPECNEEFCAISPGPSARRGVDLYFKYTVVKGDLDVDGVTIDANSLTVNGGAIKDAAGNDAILSHSAVAADTDFIVDTDKNSLMNVE